MTKKIEIDPFFCLMISLGDSDLEIPHFSSKTSRQFLSGYICSISFFISKKRKEKKRKEKERKKRKKRKERKERKKERTER